MNANTRTPHSIDESVRIPVPGAWLDGQLQVSSKSNGVVVFAHGSGSSRHSPRNQFVAEVLRNAQIGTLLFDLLTTEEEESERFTRYLRFDIDLLARRLIHAVKWLIGNREETPIGLFGASTGAAAALVVASGLGPTIRAVVSRGGRPDLAGKALERVTTPTLLIVGELDTAVLEMNRAALELLRGEKQLRVIAGASHLFEEPGTLEEVAQSASDWFRSHFTLAKVGKDEYARQSDIGAG